MTDLADPGGLRPPQGRVRPRSPARAAPTIVKQIEAAREEGDLKENGGYHAAKEEQGKNEARIRQLRQLLENAQVGEAPPADGRRRRRASGTVVTVSTSAATPMRFLLGSREVAADDDLDVYSEQSPLGAP